MDKFGNEQHVIILGAARSGTRLLRRTVAELTGYREVPWDINYIWRFGNEAHPDDALPEESASPHKTAFIRRYVNRCAGTRRSRGRFVEKTVGNVLRIPFVRTVFPNARYVHIIRDGLDVVESAARCWKAPPSASYLLNKVRSFPLIACARYGQAYMRRMLAHKLGLVGQLSSWGPRYHGIDDDVQRRTLFEVCALQWNACVHSYESARSQLCTQQLLEIRYEHLARKPTATIANLMDFLRIESDEPTVRRVASQITDANIGKRRRAPTEDLGSALAIMAPTLARWSYQHERTGARAA